MAETKHTPGPWLVHDKSTMHMQDATIAEVGRYMRVVTHNRGNGIDGLQSQANARLIAAAPELLSALEYCLAELREHMATTAGEAITIGEAALAKARSGR